MVLVTDGDDSDGAEDNSDVDVSRLSEEHEQISLSGSQHDDVSAIDDITSGTASQTRSRQKKDVNVNNEHAASNHSDSHDQPGGSQRGARTPGRHGTPASRPLVMDYGQPDDVQEDDNEGHVFHVDMDFVHGVIMDPGGQQTPTVGPPGVIRLDVLLQTPLLAPEAERLVPRLEPTEGPGPSQAFTGSASAREHLEQDVAVAEMVASRRSDNNTPVLTSPPVSHLSNGNDRHRAAHASVAALFSAIYDLSEQNGSDIDVMETMSTDNRVQVESVEGDVLTQHTSHIRADTTDLNDTYREVPPGTNDDTTADSLETTSVSVADESRYVNMDGPTQAIHRFNIVFPGVPGATGWRGDDHDDGRPQSGADWSEKPASNGKTNISPNSSYEDMQDEQDMLVSARNDFAVLPARDAASPVMVAAERSQQDADQLLEHVIQGRFDQTLGPNNVPLECAGQLSTHEHLHCLDAPSEGTDLVNILDAPSEGTDLGNIESLSCSSDNPADDGGVIDGHADLVKPASGMEEEEQFRGEAGENIKRVCYDMSGNSCHGNMGRPLPSSTSATPSQADTGAAALSSCSSHQASFRDGTLYSLVTDSLYDQPRWDASHDKWNISHDMWDTLHDKWDTSHCKWDTLHKKCETSHNKTTHVRHEQGLIELGQAIGTDIAFVSLTGEHNSKHTEDDCNHKYNVQCSADVPDIDVSRPQSPSHLPGRPYSDATETLHRQAFSGAQCEKLPTCELPAKANKVTSCDTDSRLAASTSDGDHTDLCTLSSKTALGSGSERPSETALGSGSERPSETALGSGSERPSETAIGSDSERPKETALGSGSERPSASTGRQDMGVSESGNNADSRVEANSNMSYRPTHCPTQCLTQCSSNGKGARQNRSSSCGVLSASKIGEIGSSNSTVLPAPIIIEINHKVRLTSSERGCTVKIETESLGTLNPPESLGTLNPPESLGTLSPPESLDTLNPPESLGTLSPPESLGTLSPPESLGTLNPPESLGSLSPPAVPMEEVSCAQILATHNDARCTIDSNWFLRQMEDIASMSSSVDTCSNHGVPAAFSNTCSNHGVPAAFSNTCSNNGVPAAFSNTCSNHDLPAAFSNTSSNHGFPAAFSNTSSNHGFTAAFSNSSSNHGFTAAFSNSNLQVLAASETSQDLFSLTSDGNKKLSSPAHTSSHSLTVLVSTDCAARTCSTEEPRETVVYPSSSGMREVPERRAHFSPRDTQSNESMTAARLSVHSSSTTSLLVETQKNCNHCSFSVHVQSTAGSSLNPTEDHSHHQACLPRKTTSTARAISPSRSPRAISPSRSPRRSRDGGSHRGQYLAEVSGSVAHTWLSLDKSQKVNQLTCSRKPIKVVATQSSASLLAGVDSAHGAVSLQTGVDGALGAASLQRCVASVCRVAPGPSCPGSHHTSGAGDGCTHQVFTDQVFTDQVFTDQLYTDQVYTDQVFTDQVFTDQVFTDQMFMWRLLQVDMEDSTPTQASSDADSLNSSTSHTSYTCCSNAEMMSGDVKNIVEMMSGDVKNIVEMMSGEEINIVEMLCCESLDGADDGHVEVDTCLHDGSGEMDKCVRDGSGEMEKCVRDGSGEMEKCVRDGSEEMDKCVQDGSEEMDKCIQDGSGEVDKCVQGGSGKMDKCVQDGSGEMDKRVQGGSGEMNTCVQDGSGEIDKCVQDGSGEMDMCVHGGSEMVTSLHNGSKEMSHVTCLHTDSAEMNFCLREGSGEICVGGKDRPRSDDMFVAVRDIFSLSEMQHGGSQQVDQEAEARLNTTLSRSMFTGNERIAETSSKDTTDVVLLCEKQPAHSWTDTGRCHVGHSCSIVAHSDVRVRSVPRPAVEESKRTVDEEPSHEDAKGIYNVYVACVAHRTDPRFRVPVEDTSGLTSTARLQAGGHSAALADVVAVQVAASETSSLTSAGRHAPCFLLNTRVPICIQSKHVDIETTTRVSLSPRRLGRQPNNTEMISPNKEHSEHLMEKSCQHGRDFTTRNNKQEKRTPCKTPENKAVECHQRGGDDGQLTPLRAGRSEMYACVPSSRVLRTYPGNRTTSARPVCDSVSENTVSDTLGKMEFMPGLMSAQLNELDCQQANIGHVETGNNFGRTRSASTRSPDSTSELASSAAGQLVTGTSKLALRCEPFDLASSVVMSAMQLSPSHTKPLVRLDKCPAEQVILDDTDKWLSKMTDISKSSGCNKRPLAAQCKSEILALSRSCHLPDSGDLDSRSSTPSYRLRRGQGLNVRSAMCDHGTLLDTTRGAMCDHGTLLDTTRGAMCDHGTLLDTTRGARCEQGNMLDKTSFSRGSWANENLITCKTALTPKPPSSGHKAPISGPRQRSTRLKLPAVAVAAPKGVNVVGSVASTSHSNMADTSKKGETVCTERKPSTIAPHSQVYVRHSSVLNDHMSEKFSGNPSDSTAHLPSLRPVEETNDIVDGSPILIPATNEGHEAEVDREKAGDRYEKSEMVESLTGNFGSNLFKRRFARCNHTQPADQTTNFSGHKSQAAADHQPLSECRTPFTSAVQTPATTSFECISDETEVEGITSPAASLWLACTGTHTETSRPNCPVSRISLQLDPPGQQNLGSSSIPKVKQHKAPTDLAKLKAPSGKCSNPLPPPVKTSACDKRLQGKPLPASARGKCLALAPTNSAPGGDIFSCERSTSHIGREKMEPLKFKSAVKGKSCKVMSMQQFERIQQDRHLSQAFARINSSKACVDCHMDSRYLDKERPSARRRRERVNYNCLVALENIKFVEMLRYKKSIYRRSEQLQDFKRNCQKMLEMGKHTDQWQELRLLDYSQTDKGGSDMGRCEFKSLLGQV